MIIFSSLSLMIVILTQKSELTNIKVQSTTSSLLLCCADQPLLPSKVYFFGHVKTIMHWNVFFFKLRKEKVELYSFKNESLMFLQNVRLVTYLQWKASWVRTASSEVRAPGSTAWYMSSWSGVWSCSKIIPSDIRLQELVEVNKQGRKQNLWD